MGEKAHPTIRCDLMKQSYLHAVRTDIILRFFILKHKACVNLNHSIFYLLNLGGF